MFEVSPDYGATAAALLIHYSFDLGDYSNEEMVEKWGLNYEYYWIYLAVIEALYQGRYKSISVEQILSIWQRRGKPIYHFNLEFEQLISRNVSPVFRAEISFEEPLVEVEQSPNENLSSTNDLQSLKSLTRQISLTKPPKTSTPIHTDFMVKLMQIVENSQKSLPPARSPSENS